MPSLITKNGKRCYRASVTIPGEKDLRKQKTFLDASKKSYRAAVQWEEEKKKEVKKRQARMEFINVGNWADRYLDDAKKRFVVKTYKEKIAAFKRLFQMNGVDPGMGVAELLSSKLSHTSIAYNYLNAQFEKRSGNAANKDRKNLSRAWDWGQKHLASFPKGLLNPFHAVDRFPKKACPRYVPPENDFWKVHDVAEGQDKVMLLVSFYLAARRGEIFRIKKSDLLFEENNVRLWTQKREGGDYEFDFLPMTEKLKIALLKWCDFRFSIPTFDVEHVFVCLDEEAVCDPYYGRPFKLRNHLMKRLCKRAGVKPFGFHAIRHLSATILYHNGKNLNFIQRFLRHKSPMTTQQYLHRLGLEPLREGLEDGFKRNFCEVDKTPPPENKMKSECEIIQFPQLKKGIISQVNKNEGVW